MEGITFYFDWEVALQSGLQSVMGSFGEALANIFTLFGEEAILILIMGFLYWCYDKEFGKFVGTNILMGLIWNPMLKNVVLRRRPYFDHESIRILKPVDSSADIYDISAQGYSFPSGHSTNSLIVYWSLPLYKKGKKALWVIAVVMPLLVGISRVALGAHYVTDVLVGWGMGLVIVLLLSYLQRKIENRNLLHLVLFLLAVPGVLYCKTTDYFTGLGMLAGFFLADPFERKYVNFQGTKSLPKIILRLLGGLAIYFAVNTVLKLPFSAEFLEAPTFSAFLVRAVRYAIVVFLMIGVYPLCFDKLGQKKTAA